MPFKTLQELLLQSAQLDAQIRALRVTVVLAELARLEKKTRLLKALEIKLGNELMKPLRCAVTTDLVVEQLEAVLNIVEG